MGDAYEAGKYAGREDGQGVERAEEEFKEAYRDEFVMHAGREASDGEVEKTWHPRSGAELAGSRNVLRDAAIFPARSAGDSTSTGNGAGDMIGRAIMNKGRQTRVYTLFDRIH